MKKTPLLLENLTIASPLWRLGGALILVVSIIISLSSCEKDDICPPDSAVTPLLVVRFYDFADPDEFKRVNTIKVTGEGQETAIINRITTDSIAIPLKSFDSTTTFTIIKGSADDKTTGEEVGNEDTITFNYATKEIFISRGCGYVVNYIGLTRTLDETDTAPWILGASVEISDIENQNQAHVKIFH